MGLVRGEDVILKSRLNADSPPVYLPFACARSVSFDISTDFIETSVTESGPFKTFIPSGKQYSGNIEGLVFLDKPVTTEVRATAIIDFGDINPDLFPNISSAASINVYVTPPTIINLCNIGFSEFLSLSDYINTIIAAVNSSGTGYTAANGAGNTFVITAPIGSGDTLNDFFVVSIFDIIDTSYSDSIPLIGGVAAYTPNKFGIGYMYDKIMNGEELYLIYYETDDFNHFLQKQCTVFIESINETSSFDNMVTFTASFKGNGDPIITYGEI